MNRKVQTFLICAGVTLVCSIGSFYGGKAYFYKDAWRDGVVFADTSNFKQARAEGYKAGFEYCDSLKGLRDSLDKGDMLNLNLISMELADPKNFIKVTGKIESTKKEGKHVNGSVVNTAAFVRYNDVVVVARFKDKRDAVINESNINLSEVLLSGVLYPRKKISFVLDGKVVPDLAETVEFIVESAQGTD